MQTRIKKSTQGLTIIEIVMVVAIISITLPVATNLLLVSLRAQAKVYALQEAKRNGDIALEIINKNIREQAVSIYSDVAAQDSSEVCSTFSGSTTAESYVGQLYFKDRDRNIFYFSTTGSPLQITFTKIGTEESFSPTPTPPPSNSLLTNTKVTIVPFSMSCIRNSTFSSPLVNVNFTVSSANAAARQEEKTSLQYRSQIQLRN